MNSNERVWAALNLEEPDRVPVHAIGIDGNLIDEVLGKPNKNAFELIDEIEEQYPDDWIERINEILNTIEISVFSKTIKAAYALGFDAIGVGYIPFKFESKTEFTDLFGKKFKIKNNHGNLYPDYYGGMIKDRQDWETFPKPNIKEFYKIAKKFYRGVLHRCKEIKDEICIILANNFCSVFPSAWQGMGLNWFSRALRKDPKLIRERFEQTTEFVLTIFKAYADLGAKIFIEGGDIAHSSGPFLNPKDFYKYVQPCYKRIADYIHDRGGKYILHTDGNINSLLDFIVDSGFDALQCLELPFVDPHLVKKKIGDKLCLMGNIDTKHVLVEGSKEEVENAVISAIKAMGHSGGFMISPSNMHPIMSIQRIKWMIEATRKYGVYPLDEIK